jgi:hypothetical protein
LRVRFAFQVRTLSLFLLLLTPSMSVEAKSGLWVWSGQLPRTLEGVDTLYMLQGHFWNERGYRYEFQGPPPQELSKKGISLVLTYRLQFKIPPEMVASRYRAHARAWRRQGAVVKGIQIDYDSPTAKLPNYSLWIARLRHSLESEAEVSVTGLGDWLVSASPKDLLSLAQRTDFIAFMMYHGRHSLDPVAPYLAALRDKQITFKLGLLTSQKAEAKFESVQTARGYLGDIYYVLPEARR